jgi:hypothetical protein
VEDDQCDWRNFLSVVWIPLQALELQHFRAQVRARAAAVVASIMPVTS